MEPGKCLLRTRSEAKKTFSAILIETYRPRWAARLLPHGWPAPRVTVLLLRAACAAAFSLFKHAATALPHPAHRRPKIFNVIGFLSRRVNGIQDL